MWFNDFKAAIWTKNIVNKNLQSKTPIDCAQYIHSLDRAALVALRKIPLLDTLCAKLMSIMNDKQNTMINMSTKIHITEKQLPKIL